jgi:hypothetical protein
MGTGVTPSILDNVVVDDFGFVWRVSAWVGKHVVLTNKDVQHPTSHHDVKHIYRDEFDQMRQINRE